MLQDCLGKLESPVCFLRRSHELSQTGTITDFGESFANYIHRRPYIPISRMIEAHSLLKRAMQSSNLVTDAPCSPALSKIFNSLLRRQQIWRTVVLRILPRYGNECCKYELLQSHSKHDALQHIAWQSSAYQRFAVGSRLSKATLYRLKSLFDFPSFHFDCIAPSHGFRSFQR